MLKSFSGLGSAEPIFRPYRAQTPCYWCKHVRGYAAPRALYWQCAAKKAMGQHFKKAPNSTSEIAQTLARCPDYERRKGGW